MRPGRPRGFTLVEMAVVILIIAVLSALAYDGMRRARPRATFESVAAELQSLIHSARQQALGSGVSVAVLIFPTYANPLRGTGRIVVLQDEPLPGKSFFAGNTTANLSQAGFDPAAPKATDNGQILDTVDLPDGVLVGPATGSGQAGLPFPYASITVNTDCSFCEGGGDRRGAIVFDARGRVRFYSASGSTIFTDTGQAGGASFTIYGTDLGSATTSYTTSTLVITAPQGAVSTFHNG